MKHTIRMLLGCLLPFLLIFTLPLIGIGEGTTLMFFIVLMFACHLFMMGGGCHGGQHDHHDQSKEGHGDAQS